MATIGNDEFVVVSMSVVRRIGSSLPFDVFVKRAENAYTKLFPKGEPVDVVRLDVYRKEKGVHALHVLKIDHGQYLLYLESVARALFSSSTASDAEEVTQMVLEMSRVTMQEMFVDKNFDERTASYVDLTMRGCLGLLDKKPSALIKIVQLISTQPYLLKHAIGTSILSLLLAKAAKFHSEKALLTIGIGALLHDIGMSRLQFDPDARENLTSQEWKELKQHPEIGKRLADPMSVVPSESKIIIMQHHEQPNGLGYPNNLHASDIYFPAKIVSIADSFSSLVSKRPFRGDANSPVKALEIMHADHGKFDKGLLELFSKLFVSTT